jgi:soluble lytic murein transglycosylase-like protein
MRAYSIAIFTLLLFSSHSGFTQTNNPKSPFKDVIGYQNAKSNKFEKITESQLHNFWRNTLEIPKDTKFKKAALKKIEGTNSHYMIYATSVKGNINVASKLVAYKNGWRLTGETCKCISSCTWSGCEVIGMCLCTECESGCKKEHSQTSQLYTSHFKS